MVRKLLCAFLILVMLSLSGCCCVWPVEYLLSPVPAGPIEEPAVDSATEPITEPVTQVPTILPTEPTHGDYYIPGLDVDTLIQYFNEVVLDAEYSDSGNPSVVQKWDRQVRYFVNGEPTEEDILFLESTASWLNSIYGFPGMVRTEVSEGANLQIYFTDHQGMVDLMGEQYAGCDGAVTFWYDNNRINRGTICYRTDIDQYTRNSVIQEEIYNGMGPVQDTDLRTDSMIYSGFSTPQQFTQEDKLIMTLLYHPDIGFGMDAQECAAVIRQLYQ